MFVQSKSPSRSAYVDLSLEEKVCRLEIVAQVYLSYPHHSEEL